MNELTLKESQENQFITWNTAVDEEEIWMGMIKVKPNTKSLSQHIRVQKLFIMC